MFLREDSSKSYCIRSVLVYLCYELDISETASQKDEDDIGNSDRYAFEETFPFLFVSQLTMKSLHPQGQWLNITEVPGKESTWDKLGEFREHNDEPEADQQPNSMKHSYNPTGESETWPDMEYFDHLNKIFIVRKQDPTNAMKPLSILERRGLSLDLNTLKLIVTKYTCLSNQNRQGEDAYIISERQCFQAFPS